MEIDRETIIIVIITLVTLAVIIMMIDKGAILAYMKQDQFSKEFEMGDVSFEGKIKCTDSKVVLIGTLFNKKENEMQIIPVLKYDQNIIFPENEGKINCAKDKPQCETDVKFPVQSCPGYLSFSFWKKSDCLKNNNNKGFFNLIKECSIYYLGEFDGRMNPSDLVSYEWG